LWGLKPKTFSNSGTFTTVVPMDNSPAQYGFFSATVTTNVTVDPEKNTATVYSFSTGSIYTDYHTQSATTATVTVNGVPFDTGMLSTKNSGSSLLPADARELGQVTLNLPSNFQNATVAVTTNTHYIVSSEYGKTLPGTQSVTVQVGCTK
jgi:hypothetical protein